MTIRLGVLLLVWFIAALSALATAPLPPAPPAFEIARATGPIRVDGDLSDPAWARATRVDTWYETNPGDNVAPRVRNVGYLTYDERYFYAAFEFEDPDTSKIRAPYSDRDNLGGDTDYGGVILDTRNDGRTGLLLLANPRGVQYDAVSDDVSGNEDPAPDVFWDSAARVTGKGWALELRVPFSSLRYPKADPNTWGIMLYRNWPREFRYQMLSTTLPRGSNCFICRSSRLSGLRGLPARGGLVLAPYASSRRTDLPLAGLGSPLAAGPVKGEAGLDVKWLPDADHALDATFNPDFSQIESDLAQIGVNERFALFFQEKRPFFLEGVELLSTPVQAVYTRTVTSPRWGARATGKVGKAAYTALVTEDEGGGLVILPGPNASDFATQDFRSTVALARVRRDLGRSFVSLLLTDREVHGGGAYNRVLGPDFQWRLGQGDTFTGQFLWSDTRTPRRPDLAAGWDGRSLAGHALDASWWHSTRKLDWTAEVKDFSDRFRADDGFVPQVGFRQTYGEAGYTLRPQGFLRRLRAFAIFDRSQDRAGGLLNRQYSFGAGMDGRFNSFARVRYAFDRVRAGAVTLSRRQLLYDVQANPSRLLSQLRLNGFFGEEVDFAGARVGRGASVAWRATLRPTDHVELRFNDERRWLNVDRPGGGRGRLFTAGVDRLRATYSFNARSYLRLVAQYVGLRRDPGLFASAVPRRSGDFSGSALFAYRLNWQTVLFVGYGDNRALSDDERIERAERQFFAKVSYAFQR